MSIWTFVHSAPSLGHEYILLCLNALISVHLRHLKCSTTYLQYPGHQACYLNLLYVAATPPWILPCTLLITSFLKIWGGTIVSALNIMSLSTVTLCRVSLKGFSAIVQLLHTFFLVRSGIPFSIGFAGFFCWVFCEIVRPSHPFYNSILRILMFLSIFTLKS